MLTLVEPLFTTVFSLGKKQEEGWRHLLRRAEEGAITQPAEERVIQTVPYKEHGLWRSRWEDNHALFKKQTKKPNKL